jgi:hypothetical protein
MSVTWIKILRALLCTAWSRSQSSKKPPRSSNQQSQKFVVREDEMDAETSPDVANDEMSVTVRVLTTSFQTMQVDQQRNRQFLETVTAQQEQLHQCAQWSEALQDAQSSATRSESVLRLRNAHFEPISRQAANTFGGNSIPGNIVILEDSDDDDLQSGSTRSGT